MLAVATCPRCGAQLAEEAAFCGMCGTRLVDPVVGRVLGGRYAVRERIGAGSLGVRFRGEQLGVRRPVEIKLLPREAAEDRDLVARFRREGDLLCRLRSPHTVTTFEYAQEPDGTLYIVTELLSGRSLADLLRDGVALDEARVLRIMVGVCDSLAEAHAHEIVHRDLRPECIVLELRAANPDFVKVLDFGLAKLLSSESVISAPNRAQGTVAYSSPEQLLQQPIDARADLYSLGALAYQLATAHHPFESARGIAEMVTAHVERVPPPASSLRPEISRELDAILIRCLEKDPRRRFPDARTLSNVIDGVLSSPQQHDTFRQS